MSNPEPERYLIPLAGVAKQLAMSLRQLYRTIDVGLIAPPVKQGNRSYLFNTDIEAYMKKLEERREE